uniref:Uncharacterized protein n=1 Tax=Strongyloides stercoralis TaxID=6248 RepID=A0AAF5CY79_STRER
VALLKLYRKRVNFFFWRNSFSNNASNDKESSHCYRFFGGCYSTGAECGEWRLFWKKLEDVPILQLNLKHRSSSVMDCYSTGTESRAWKLLWKELEAVALLELYQKRVNFFLGGIDLELMLVTIVKPDIIIAVLEAVIQLELNVENGDFSGRNLRIVWKLLWKELEAVALLELNRKRVNFFLGGIHLELMLVTIVDPDIIVAVLEAVVQLELILKH